MRIHHLLLSTIVVFECHASAFAQSLADVAAVEAARRKTVTASSKVYTNDSLGHGSQQSSVPAPTPATSKPETPSKADPAAEDAKNEKYWRGRITAVLQGIARNKVLSEAMQSRINALNAEALSVDDPGQRAIVQSNLTKAAGEMQRLALESEKYNKDLIGIQEEARRANVPPGWLR